MNVCDNLGDHLVGNVYVKVLTNLEFYFKTCLLKSGLLIFVSIFLQFRYEEDAEKAVNDLANRWFNGRPIHSELSPVTDFREACCRQYEMG